MSSEEAERQGKDLAEQGELGQACLSAARTKSQFPIFIGTLSAELPFSPVGIVLLDGRAWLTGAAVLRSSAWRPPLVSPPTAGNREVAREYRGVGQSRSALRRRMGHGLCVSRFHLVEKAAARPEIRASHAALVPPIFQTGCLNLYKFRPMSPKPSSGI
jgi:hypothetical protein